MRVSGSPADDYCPRPTAGSRASTQADDTHRLTAIDPGNEVGAAVADNRAQWRRRRFQHHRESVLGRYSLFHGDGDALTSEFGAIGTKNAELHVEADTGNEWRATVNLEMGRPRPG